MKHILRIHYPKQIRLKESYIFFSIIVTFVILCFMTMLLLPELGMSIPQTNVLHKVYQKFQRVGPDLFLPKPLVSTKTTTEIKDNSVLRDNHRVNISDINRIHNNQSSDEYRRSFIKKMMKHAWSNYVNFAWGKNELRPLTRTGHLGSVFGNTDVAATIVDSLDTLYLMDLHEEFRQGELWVQYNLTKQAFTNTNVKFSVFETNIRFIGGLLSCYALTKNKLFLDRAQMIADLLLPAFETKTGIPKSLINFRTNKTFHFTWVKQNCSILSEFGTLYLEFNYLSKLTGNDVYRQKVDIIKNILKHIDKPMGLYPNYLNFYNLEWGSQHFSIGALGDSFYEYLLKSWLQSKNENNDSKVMFEEAINAIIKHLLKTSKMNHFMYFGDMKNTHIDTKMDHLACFSGGLLALAAQVLPNTQYSKIWLDIAENITHTCYQSYNSTELKLGPESFHFDDVLEAKAKYDHEKQYLLRPEVIESYFILWRITGKQQYKEWGWQAAIALYKFCQTPGGFSGIENVYVPAHEIKYDDVQQSFLLAETFKYLYLLFSDNSVLDLNQWILNTEAHPLPVLS